MEYAEVEIEITREVAMRGERWICTRCPVALAIKEHLHDGADAFVGQGTVGIATSKRTIDVKLPKPARDFIESYDHKLRIDFPVKFKLSIPKHALRGCY